MRISQMSEDEAKNYIFDAYNHAVQACADGELPDHPSGQIIDWMKRGRARDAKARDEENSGLGPRNLQRRPDGRQIKSGADEDPDMSEDAEDPDMSEDAEDPDMSEDDDPKNTARPGPNAGKKPAMDGVLSSDQNSKPVFTYSDGRTVVGDRALEASARCSNPVRVRAMKRAIPSYGRLK